jgi:uncharacterized membrane protein
MKMHIKFSRLILAISAGAGLAASIYLTVLKLTNNQDMCLDGIGDCWTVNSSTYAQFLGIPTALFGVGAYLAMLALLWAETRYSFWKSNGPTFLFGFSLMGVIISLFLTYVEVAIIDAICPFCVVSAIAMLILFLVNTSRLVKVPE